MSTEKVFLAYKRKFLISAIVKSIICGISFGFAAVSIVLLSLKLSAITINAGYYVLMGIVGAVACGAVAYMFFRPTDKSVAKRLDTDHDLDERIQTSLEFSNQDGMLVKMQRFDAGMKMKELPRTKFRFSRVWQFFVIALLAVALTFTAFFIPAKTVLAEEGPIFGDIDDTPYSLTAFQEAALNELIKNVRESALEPELRADIAAELTELIEKLRLATNMGEMRNSVNYAIYYVNENILSANSNVQISDALKDSAPYLSDAIDDGIVTHSRIQLLDFNNVKFYNTNMIGLISNAVMPHLINMFSMLTGELTDSLNEYAELISSALDAAEVDEGDGLYSVLNEFTNQLIEISSQSANEASKSIDNLYKVFSDNLTDVISVQAYNLAMNRFIRNRLQIVFGMFESDPDFVPDEPTTDPDEPGGPDSSEGPSQGGGELDGDVIYGSKDKVFNPLTGEYVPYGELLQWYYEEFGKLVESGNLSPEQVHAATVYFDLLFNGFDD